MPDKDGSDDEKKSAKSVVNKRQKQFMNQEDYIPEKLSPENVNRELDKMDVRDKNKKPLISKEKSDSIQAKSTFNQASEYATKQRPKIGGGERPDLKSKGGSASTGTSDIKIGGPKKDPKSAGGLSKGNTPVKVNIKKKPDLSKYFGEKIDPLNFGKSKRTPEQKQQARSQKQRTDAVFNTKKGLSDMKTGTQSSEFLKTQKDAKKKPEDSQPLDEEGYDIARDMGRVRPSKDKKDATTMPVSKEMRKTQKVNKGPSALERVKAKYGKSVMNVGKKKVKEELDLTKVAEAFGGYIVEQEDDKNQNQQQQQKPQQQKPRKRLNRDAYNKTMEKFKGEKKPRRGFEDVTGEGKVKFPKTREELEAKRKQYEIDDKGNITDRGVEKYAREIYRTNLPLTKAQLNKARQFAVGGKKIKDSEGKVIGTTTGKYGGRLSPKASEEEMKQTQAYLKKRGLKVPDKIKPQKDRVTVNTTDTDKVATPKSETEPEKGPLAKAQQFARKNPIGGYAAVELGKGIIGKLMKVKGAVPGVVGGTVGRRSARGGGGL